jgi:hypothetical protein
VVRVQPQVDIKILISEKLIKDWNGSSEIEIFQLSKAKQANWTEERGWNSGEQANHEEQANWTDERGWKPGEPVGHEE